MADRSTFQIQIDGAQASPTPYGANVAASRGFTKNLLFGDGTDQMRVLKAYEQVIAPSGTLAVNLTSDLDRFGVALSLDDIALIFIENVIDATGGGACEVRPNGVNGFTNMLGAASALKLPYGSGFCIWNFTADKYDVAAGNRAFDIVETGAALPVLLRMQIWGRR